MNAIVPINFDPSVPAYLQRADLMIVGRNALAGVGGGAAAPHRISIKSSRFRFIAPDGTATNSTQDNGVLLNVIVVGANDKKSKSYYAGAFDQTGVDNKPPDCYSDNGIGPSERSLTPQAASCAVCPKAVWGSKITPSGTGIPACGDRKKLAVVLSDNPTGIVYLLNIPGGSLGSWGKLVNLLNMRGVPLAGMVIQVGFEPDAPGQKLTFKPAAFLAPNELAAVEHLLGSDEVRDVVGANDKAIVALAAPPSQNMQFSQETKQAAAAAQFAPGPVGVPPLAAMPVAQVATAPPALLDLPAHTTAALATPPAPVVRRGRRTNAEIAAALGAQSSQQALTTPPAPAELTIPSFIQPQQQNAAPVLQPAGSEIDSMLDKIMSVPR